MERVVPDVRAPWRSKAVKPEPRLPSLADRNGRQPWQVGYRGRTAFAEVMSDIARQDAREEFAWKCLKVGAVVAVSAAAIGIIGHWYLTTRCDRFNSYMADLLQRTAGKPTIPIRARDEFKNMPDVITRRAVNHTHPDSARCRSLASSNMTLLGQRLGLTPYYCQQSPADQRNLRAGSLSYHWAKDLGAERRTHIAKDVEMLAIVDVDYYLDMPEILATHSVPTVLYTFVPTRAGRSDGEYAFTFNRDNSVEYRLSGGSAYSHQIWNYGHDTVIAVTKSWYGWKRCTVFGVDRRQVDADHQMVLLTPIARSSCWLLGLDNFVDGTVLRRLKVVTPQRTEQGVVDFVRLDVHGVNGTMRSTGRVGQTACATISARLDDTLANLAVLTKVSLTPASVKTAIQDTDPEVAAMLTLYHRSAAPSRPDTVYPVAATAPSSSVFDYDPVMHDPDAKMAQKPFMRPLALGAFIPAISAGNDTQSIKGRVESVAAPQLPITGHFLGRVKEFLEKLIPEPHRGHPLDEQSVYDRQPRPTQQAILREASLSGGLSDEAISSFMKRESYAKVTDPRNISQIPGRNKLEWSRFLYAYSDSVMKPQAWYAFSKTPLEIAQRVADICENAVSYVVKTDLARCDGRVSNRARELESHAMARFFSVEYHTALTKASETQRRRKARTATGYKYETGESRLSGSAETADHNTLLNVFMAFDALRDVGLTVDEAWEALGIYGGDDGLSADIPEPAYVRSCKNIGQVLEYAAVRRGDPGVDFLARLFSPDVWGGCLDSMCDAKRQIIKLHISQPLSDGIEPLQKLLEKMAGFAATDRNTPVIGEFVRALEMRYPLGLSVHPTRSGWWGSIAGEVNFPNANGGGWMDAEFATNFPTFDREKFTRWAEWISFAGDPLTPPLCSEEVAPINPPAPVVVDGDLHLPAASAAGPAVAAPAPAPGQAPAAPPAKQVCMHYARGQCRYPADKCRFEHVGAVPQAPVSGVCFDFVKGKCARNKCKFTH